MSTTGTGSAGRTVSAAPDSVNGSAKNRRAPAVNSSIRRKSCCRAATFRNGRAGAAFEQAIAAVNARPARAVLDLVVHPREGSVVDVDLSARVTDARERADAVIALALVQSGLASDVKAGENAGKRLQHDHVVRQWRQAVALDSSGAGSGKLSLALPADPGPLSVVLLAENARTGDVLQVLELPLCAAR